MPLKPPGSSRMFAFALALGVLVTGVALTLVAGYTVHSDARADAAVQFDRLTELVESDIQRRLEQTVYGLRGAAGLYAANQAVSRRTFRDYVSSRDLAREFPGVRGFGFVSRVPREDLDAFVARQQLDDAPDFRVRTEGAAPDLYVIKFIEPLANNLQAWGYDLGSEAVRRQAIETAVKSGRPTLSGRIVLLQDGKQGAGFLYMLPVFRPGTQPSDPAERTAALRGLVYAPIVVAEVLEPTRSVSDGQVEFDLFDGSTPTESNQIFSSLPPLPSVPTAASAFAADRFMLIGGRPLSLRIQSSPAFDASVNSAMTWGVVAGGGVLSLLLSLSVWLLATGRSRAEALAQAMTADLDRLARVVQHTSNAVYIIDRDQKITWVNEGFTRMFGYTLPEAAGHRPIDLLGSGKTDKHHLQRLAEAFAKGESCRLEVLNRAKDGQLHWLDLDIQPTHDADGRLTGFMEVGLDITPRKHAEERLRSSNAFLDRAERIAGVGGWEMDLKAGTLHWTDQTCRIYDLEPGFQPSLEEHLKYFGPEAQQLIQRTVQACAVSGQPWDIELPMQTSKGRFRWIRSVGQAEAQGGKPTRLVGALQDVTDKHALEEELRRGHALLRTVLDNLPCGLSVFDAELKLAASNTQFASLLGLPDSLFAGPVTTFENIIRYNAARGDYGTADREAAVQSLLALAHNPEPHRMQRRRDNGIVVDIRGVPMPGGGFVTTYTDITSEELHSAVLKESEERLQRALEGSRLVLWDMNLGTRLVYLSPGWTELLGEAPRAMVGSVDKLQTLVHRDDAPTVHAALQGLLKGQTQSYSVEFRVRRPDGQFVWVHVVGRVTEREDSGRVIRVVGTLRDITESRRAELELRLARDAADEANRAKTDFLATMSHEIRTPLNGVIGITRFLLEESLTPVQRQHAELIDSSAQSLLVLINDFLDFSKIEAGELAVEAVAFDLHRMLNEASRLHALRASEKSVGFSLEIDPGVPAWVSSDPTRVRQIVNNLLGNALKFTAHGHVKFRLSSAPAGEGKAILRIAISDTGVGIAEEVQKKLFTRFSQADSSTSRKYGGTGLGLAIVKQLSELLCGSVELQSTPGQGSTFVVTLPVDVVSAAQAVVPESPTAEAGPHPACLLLVEDNPTNQIVAVGALRRLGYADVTVAADGREAVEFASHTRFDLILMDCHMPEMDGYTATRLLRERGFKAPIVAMTASAMKGDREKCLAAGMDDYLSKPMEKQVLADMLQRWLQPSTAVSAAGPVAAGAVVVADIQGQQAPARVVYDRAAVAERFKGDAELLPIMRASFMKHTPVVIGKLQRAVEAGESQNIRLHSHTLVGSAATVGAQALRLTAHTLELGIIDGQTLDAAGLCAQIEQDFQDYAVAVAAEP